MDKYISREAVVRYLKGYSEKELNRGGNFGMITSSVLGKAERAISEMPAADVQPVKHGNWVLSDDKNWLTCPFCGAVVDVSVGILMYVDNDEVDHINFCPNCGARMDPTKLHYVLVPLQHIVIDFDIHDSTGEKNLLMNLEAASKFPPTYAELSKSGNGIHLHWVIENYREVIFDGKNS